MEVNYSGIVKFICYDKYRVIKGYIESRKSIINNLKNAIGIRLIFKNIRDKF